MSNVTIIPSTKKELIKALKPLISEINGKKLAKCLFPTLKKEFVKHFPDAQEAKKEEKTAKKATKKASVKKQATKQATKQPAKEDKVEAKKEDAVSTSDVEKMSSSELIAFAMKMAEKAKKAGEANKEEITKKRASRKSKWADSITALLGSDKHKNKDGSYSFTLQDVIDITGLLPVSESGSLKSWVIYSGDWKPTYRGVGSNVVLLGFQAKVTGAPSNKTKRASFDLADNSWKLTLSPITASEALKLMVPRAKGTIDNWVYTSEQVSDMRAKADSE